MIYVETARIGDSLVCPGCGETLTLDWADGWRNDGGLSCKPGFSTHTDYIKTGRIVR